MTIRFHLPVSEAEEIREELKPEFKHLPKLNKETFESFGEWVFEDVADCVIQALWNSKSGSDLERDDGPSKVEPW